jgi:hypothetical protein
MGLKGSSIASNRDPTLELDSHKQSMRCFNLGGGPIERDFTRYERGATLITSNLPFDEWTETFGSERPDRRAARQADASRQHPRDERRQLSPWPEPRPKGQGRGPTMKTGPARQRALARASYVVSARARALTQSPPSEYTALNWQTFAPPSGWFLLRR